MMSSRVERFNIFSPVANHLLGVVPSLDSFGDLIFGEFYAQNFTPQKNPLSCLSQLSRSDAVASLKAAFECLCLCFVPRIPGGPLATRNSHSKGLLKAQL